MQKLAGHRIWFYALLAGSSLSFYSWHLVIAEEEPPYRISMGLDRVIASASMPGYFVAFISLPDRGSDLGPDPESPFWISILANSAIWSLCIGVVLKVLYYLWLRFRSRTRRI